MTSNDLIIGLLPTNHAVQLDDNEIPLYRGAVISPEVGFQGFIHTNGVGKDHVNSGGDIFAHYEGATAQFRLNLATVEAIDKLVIPNHSTQILVSAC